MAITKDDVKALVANTLGVAIDQIQDELAVGDIPEWDSLAHMRIITALETDLGVVLDIEQTLDIEDVDDIVEAVTDKQ
jgi:acyl carrier protein